jgi:hypothetical protein
MNQNSLWAVLTPSGLRRFAARLKLARWGEFFEPEGLNQVLVLHHTKKGPIGALFGMAVDAVSVGIVSGKFPENGKSTGKFLIFGTRMQPCPLLTTCFDCQFSRLPSPAREINRELSGITHNCPFVTPRQVARSAKL